METESVISCIIRKIQVNLETWRSSAAAKYFSDTKTALMCRMKNNEDPEVADVQILHND